MALSAARARNVQASANNAYQGRRAVVVGGTSGIGQGIAIRLAEANYSVTIVGRNAQRGQELVEEMKAKGAKDGEYEFVSCDGTLLRSVRAFADGFAKKHSSLDILVQTQGMASAAGRTETDEGLDQKLALHYYGRMALIDALLPLLRAAPSPRVLSVLSGGVHSAYQDYKKDPELKTHYSLKNAADAVGFYNDLGLDGFAHQPENKGITFIHAAPGFVNTNWGTELPFILRGLVRILQPLGTSIEDCAEFMCLPLLSPDSEQEKLRGQVVIIGSKGEPAKKTDQHDQALEFVWNHTRDVLSRIRNPSEPSSSSSSSS